MALSPFASAVRGTMMDADIQTEDFDGGKLGLSCFHKVARLLLDCFEASLGMSFGDGVGVLFFSPHPTGLLRCHFELTEL